MDDWSFTIEVSSKLVATVRSFMSTRQRVVVRAKCSLPEFKHKVRSKFGIPSQVDLQFFWDKVELTLANFKTILPQVRFKSRSPKLVLSFDTRKWGFIYLELNVFWLGCRWSGIRRHQHTRKRQKNVAGSDKVDLAWSPCYLSHFLFQSNNNHINPVVSTTLGQKPQPQLLPPTTTTTPPSSAPLTAEVFYFDLIVLSMILAADFILLSETSIFRAFFSEWNLVGTFL